MLCFNLLKRMIESNNYTTKEEMQNKINIFFEKGKINKSQKSELEELLK